jgi:tetratricopeptide (TPR) repeat protein
MHAGRTDFCRRTRTSMTGSSWAFSTMMMALLILCQPACAQTVQPNLKPAATRQLKEILGNVERETSAILDPSNEARVLNDLVGLYTLMDDTVTAHHLISQIKVQGERNMGWCLLSIFFDDRGAERDSLAAFALIDTDKDRQKCIRSLADTQIARSAAGHVEGALKWISMIPDAAQRSILLARLAVVQATAGNATEADRLFKTAIETAATLDDKDGSALQALQKIAVAQADAGRNSESRRMLLGMRQEIGSLNSRGQTDLLELAIALAQTGSTADAIETVRMFGNQTAQENTLWEIADRQAQKGDVQGAFSTLTTIRTPSLRSYIFGSIAKAQAKQGDIASTLATAQRISDQSDKDSALATIAISQARVGQAESSLQTFSMIKDASLRAQVLIETGSYQTETTSVCRKEIMQKASRAAAAIPNSDFLHEIAWNQSACGYFTDAQETAADIQDETRRAETLEGVAYNQARRGEIEKALDWIRKAPSPLIRARSFLGLAEALLNDGPPGRARVRIM